MKAGDKVRAIWEDGEEIVGTYVREERGYVLIQVKEKIIACLPTHLKTLEIVNESR